METLLQGLVGLSCLFLVTLGVRTMFVPSSMVEILAIEPKGATGLNTVRGFLGGLFIGSSILLACGLITGNSSLILAVATVMSMVVVGRLSGVILDGFDKKVLFPLVAEIVMVTIFILAYTQLGV